AWCAKAPSPPSSARCRPPTARAPAWTRRSTSAAPSTARRSSGRKRRPGLDPPDQANDLALDAHLLGAHIDRLHLAVGRLEPYPIALTKVALERRLAVLACAVGEQGNYHVAVVRRLRRADDDQVPIVDEVLDHRLAADAQRVGILGRKIVTELDHIIRIADGLDRCPGGDAPHYRHGVDPPARMPFGRGGEAQAAAGIRLAHDVALLREDGQMIIDVAGGANAHRLPDLSIGGRPVVLLHVLSNELENSSLPLAERFHRQELPRCFIGPAHTGVWPANACSTHGDYRYLMPVCQKSMPGVEKTPATAYQYNPPATR